jgi:heavy metal sensor kinase
MSLRARLTLLYSTLIGGILLIFGALVYVLVSLLLINSVDETLTKTVSDIIKSTRVSPVGELNMITLPSLELTANVYVQLWDRAGTLTAASPGIREMREPLDATNLNAARPIIANVEIGEAHLRVLTAPLEVGGRPIGVLQAATSLTLVNATRTTLLSILIGATILSMIIAALGSWWSIGRSLAPLETVTATAEQITRADDLSRRIPYSGSAHDEIGTLIRAFNRTLERLENLFMSQQRFLADVSHELRTPLTVIKGNANLMRKIKQADEESLMSIDEEADRLTRMVGDLLLLAQAESGKLPLNLQPMELDTLLLEVFHEMRVLAGDKVKIKMTDIDQALVNGDRDRLKQVLLNLIGNAVQYTPHGGDVYLNLSKSDEMARLIIRDTGPGIPTKDLPHIFDRFYRGEKSRTRSKSSGYGLGLSIAYWIVDAHGGRIEVDSQEGKGTTFAVWLPLHGS